MAKAKSISKKESAQLEGLHVAINRAQLIDELAFVGQTAVGKEVIPILKTVKLTFSTESLEMVCTSLDVTARSEVPLDGLAFERQSVGICVDQKAFLQIVRSLRGEMVNLTLIDDRLHISAGKSKFNLMGFDPAGFPNVETIEGETVRIPSALLRSMFATSHFCVTREKSRYSLNALCFRVHPDRIEMMATDGHRLARSLARQENKIVIDGQIPQPAFKAISALFENAAGDVEIVNGANGISFENNARRIVSRLVAGNFPNFDLILNKEVKLAAKFNRDEFLEVIRRVLLISEADTETRTTRAHIETAEDLIILTGATSGVGEGLDSLDAKTEIHGKWLFNAHYLVSGVAACKGAGVSLHLDDPKAPMFVFSSSWPTGEDTAPIEWTYSVMAMRE